MTMQEIIAKAANGTALDEADVEFLRSIRSGPDESETETLKTSLNAAEGERDRLRAELEELHFQSSIGKLAREYHFTDPEYLAYLCRKENVSPEDAAGCAGYMEKLQQSMPRFFHPALTPGVNPEAETNAAHAGEKETLLELLSNAPEFH